jgi:hypothetical protein
VWSWSDSSAGASSVNAGELDALVAITLAVPADRDPCAVSDLCRQAAMASPFVRLDRPVSVKLGLMLGEPNATKVTIEAYVYDVRLEPKMESNVLARALRALQQAGHMPKVSEYEFQAAGARAPRQVPAPGAEPRSPAKAAT